jgi:SAM-dependent methyltransferase
MAECNNPETDVNEFMKRVRAEAVRRRLAFLRGDGSDRASAPVPEIPHAVPLPVMITPPQLDLKTDQLTNAIEQARDTTQVSQRIPKPFQRLFRKQGRYNNLLLESVTILAGATMRLSSYIGELTPGFETQISRLEKILKNLETQIDIILEYVCNLRNQQDRITEEAGRSHAHQDEFGNQIRDLCRNVKQLDDRQVADGTFLKSELHLLHRGLSELRALSRGQKELAAPTTVDFDEHKLDAFYVAFENQFRGSRELIKERVRSYLKDVKEAGLGMSDSPILDLGCGRGDWLEVAVENGFTAEGIDSNVIMVAECKQRGFRVTEGDALEYLRSLPAESLGVITGFHIIEHLEFHVLVDLLHESLRVLRPGGLAIFETPNPDNVLVGSNRFYLDPTHRHPLPKEYMSFLLRSVGFTDVVLRPLHPDKDSLLSDGESPKLRDLVNRLFFGDQDYAVLGRKQSR